jgi:hypothetical protein
MFFLLQSFFGIVPIFLPQKTICRRKQHYYWNLFIVVNPLPAEKNNVDLKKKKVSGIAEIDRSHNHHFMPCNHTVRCRDAVRQDQ